MNDNAPISQVKYWLEGTTEDGANDADGGNSGKHLSYEVFVILSVLGGFLGLDHLYLRSPITFIAKIIVNVLCFGVWWLYDAVHALFNPDVIKLYGLNLPVWGPIGIAAGVLSNDVPDKKHFRFFIYSVALLFGGIIGMDSFIVGDRRTGVIRLLCAVSLIFLPIAALWWGYELFQYFVNTEEAIGNSYQFFGAPKYTRVDWLRKKFPLLAFLFSPFEFIKSMINSIIGPGLLDPITKTAQSAINTVDHAVSAVDNTVQLGRNTLSKSSEIINQVGKTLDTVAQASSITPAASMYATAQSALGQTGGSLSDNLNPIGYLLLGTLCLIVLTGFCATFYRIHGGQQEQQQQSKQSKQSKQSDDAPPEPGILRGTHSEGKRA